MAPVLAVPLLVAGILLVYQWVGRGASPAGSPPPGEARDIDRAGQDGGQPPPPSSPQRSETLRDLQDVSELEAKFGQETGKPRLVLLLSPT